MVSINPFSNSTKKDIEPSHKEARLILNKKEKELYDKIKVLLFETSNLDKLSKLKDKVKGLFEKYIVNVAPQIKKKQLKYLEMFLGMCPPYKKNNKDFLCNQICSYVFFLDARQKQAIVSELSNS